MEFWNDIINTAVIGTHRKGVESIELPAALNECRDAILAKEAIGKEEKFLQIAALAFNYRQCGRAAVRNEYLQLPAAGPEEKQYCGTGAREALKDILTEENIPLLKFWLMHCHEKNLLVQPDLIPVLFNLCTQHKRLQNLIVSCVGKRGEWLSRLNSIWKFSVSDSSEEQWLNGTMDQRKQALKVLRSENMAEAVRLLQQTWGQEDANNKLAFLEILSQYPVPEDIPFLESLQNEKSKKVKEEATHILKRIPGSAIVLQYEDLLRQSVTLKKEKGLLGLATRTNLQFQLPAVVDDSVFKSGIEKLSSSKELTDEEFIVYQLIQYCPPSFWRIQLTDSPQEIIDLFQKDPTGKKMLPALAAAVRHFQDRDWASHITKYSKVLYLDIITLLPEREQELYGIKFFDEYPDSILKSALRRQMEWSDDLSRKILTYCFKNVYVYNKNFYSECIHLLPVSASVFLGGLAAAQQTHDLNLSSISDYILKLLKLKSQTIESFK